MLIAILNCCTKEELEEEEDETPMAITPETPEEASSFTSHNICNQLTQCSGRSIIGEKTGHQE
jgi:hypothetical protein